MTDHRPKILDLFCGAGGAAMGYYRAGFDVVGVDLNPQPNYPFHFIQTDAMAGHVDLDEFDVIHASPPCQSYSAMSACRPGLAAQYPDLVSAVRAMLVESGLPYVIENVPGAPLEHPFTLCGLMFDLELYRHRLFESNLALDAPEHPPHDIPTSKAGHWRPGTIMSVAGHVAPMAHARKIMGIDWSTRDELVEAIPPAYTEHIGNQIRALLAPRR